MLVFIDAYDIPSAHPDSVGDIGAGWLGGNDNDRDIPVQSVEVLKNFGCRRGCKVLVRENDVNLGTAQFFAKLFP